MNKEIEKLRDNGCGMLLYKYYTKGYRCNGKDFLCYECFDTIRQSAEKNSKANKK